MVNTDFTSLCQRILEYYHRKGWYGSFVEASDAQSGSDESWIMDGFTSPFPRATEEQLRLTEEAMGFPYPPLLRSLYLKIGNGGFGPGQGLVGAFPTESEIGDDIDDKEWILQRHLCPFPLEDWTLIDLEQYEAQHGQIMNLRIVDVWLEDFALEDWTLIDLEQYEVRQMHVWPKDFIYLCDWGCGYWSFLHARTGHVYYFAEDYLSHEADSLEEWLERWLQEEEAHVVNSYIVNSYIVDSYIIE